jgi:hypothetical protein
LSKEIKMTVHLNFLELDKTLKGISKKTFTIRVEATDKEMVEIEKKVNLLVNSLRK